METLLCEPSLLFVQKNGQKIGKKIAKKTPFYSRRKLRIVLLEKSKREEERRMEQVSNFIKPELLVLIPVLYFLGYGLKSQKLKTSLSRIFWAV